MSSSRLHAYLASAFLIAASLAGCDRAPARIAITAPARPPVLTVQTLDATRVQIDVRSGDQTFARGTLRLDAIQINDTWQMPRAGDELAATVATDVTVLIPRIISRNDTDRLGGVQLRLDLAWEQTTGAPPRFTQFGYAKFSAAGVLEVPAEPPLNERGILPPMIWRSDLAIDELLRQAGLAPGICWWTTSVQDRPGSPLIGVAAGRARHLPTRIAPWRNGNGLSLVVQIGGLGEALRARSGETYDLESVLVGVADRYDRLQQRLADHFSSEYEPRPRRAVTEVPRMYTTWHADFENISRQIILAHLDRLAELGLDKTLNAFQIDDGYQRHWGDWLATADAFGADLTTIADDIRARGYSPGLWLAPPLVAADSAIARQHPDWILRRNGQPVRCDTCNTRGIELQVLDFGNDEVVAWLEQVMGRLQDAGFELFKLDFLATATAHGNSSATETTGLDRFHRMLAAIGRGTRAGTFLWSATYPLLPTLGALDGYRVSGDLGFPFFDDLPLANWYHYARTLALRAAWLNRWGVIDPDGFFVRGQPDAARIQTLLWLHAMAGGMVALGDRDEDLTTGHAPSALPQPLRDGIGTASSWIPVDPLAYAVDTWTPSPVVEQLLTVDRNTEAQPPFWVRDCPDGLCVIAINWVPFAETLTLETQRLAPFGNGNWDIVASWGGGQLSASRSALTFTLPAMGSMAVHLVLE